MPDIDGWTGCKDRRRADCRNTHHPIDLGDRPGDLARRANWGSANLLKPFEQSELLETILR